MPGLARTLVTIVAASVCLLASVPLSSAADGAPVGAWRTTNGCFLIAFLLSEGGRAQAVYMTGEQDENAAWTWDGSTLKIISKTFDLDMFAGHVTAEGIDAEYVWHDLDKDELHRQACAFERFTPPGI
jgi:hypothetical protein